MGRWSAVLTAFALQAPVALAAETDRVSRDRGRQGLHRIVVAAAGTWGQSGPLQVS